MINIDNISNKLYEYLTDIVELSQEERLSIKTALRLIRDIAPTDAPLVFKRLEDLTAISDDIAWVTMTVQRKLSEIKSEINSIKAPNFTALVRQGRPSTQAIEYEILFNNSELKDLENNKNILVNIVEYLQHIEKSIDRYIFILRDKLKY